MKRTRISILVLGLFLVASCLTINVYFPTAAVQEAANTFVKDVQTDSQKANPSPSQSPQKSGEQGWLRWNFVGSAYAQGESAININTPEATKLKDEMKARFSQIAAFKDKGAVGEDNKGLLSERDLQALLLPERAKVKQLISETNATRMKLYQEIIRANSYPPDKLKEIQGIFAKSWQENAKAGWWVQGVDGKWTKK